MKRERERQRKIEKGDEKVRKKWSGRLVQKGGEGARARARDRESESEIKK